MTHQATRIFLIATLSVGIAVVAGVSFFASNFGVWSELSIFACINGFLAFITSAFQLAKLDYNEEADDEYHRKQRVHLFELRERLLSRVEELDYLTKHIARPNIEQPSQKVDEGIDREPSQLMDRFVAQLEASLKPQESESADILESLRQNGSPQGRDDYFEHKLAHVLSLIRKDLNELLELDDYTTAELVGEKVRHVLQGTPWTDYWSHLFGLSVSGQKSW